MDCPKCGKALKEGAKFCNACGAKIEADARNQKYVRKSETDTDKTEVLSTAKPASVIPASARPAAGLKTPVKEKRRSKGLIAGLSIAFVILVLVIGGIAAYMAGAFDSILYKDQKTVLVETDDSKEDDETERGSATPDDATEAADSEESSAAAETIASTALPEEAPTTQPVLPSQSTVVVADSSLMPTAAYIPTQAYQPTAAPVYQAPVRSGDYILQDSSSRSLNANEVSGLTKDQLRLARNEVYARHGRTFKDAQIQSYFDSKSWYTGRISPEAFSEDTLSQTEKDNIKLIEQYEALAR